MGRSMSVVSRAVVVAGGFCAAIGVAAGCGPVIHQAAVQDHHLGGPAFGTGLPASPRARAAAFAWRMLFVQHVPPGVQPLTGRHPAGLAPATRLGGKTTSVDLAKVYRVPGTPQQVLRFISSHRPVKTANVSRGRSTQSGVTEQFVNYFFSRPPDGVQSAMLVASVLPAGHGHTWLRYDAQAVWGPVRTVGEYLNPTVYRAVEVIAHQNPPRPGLVTEVFTARSVIAELARRLNAMPAAGNALYYDKCLRAPSAGDRLIFEPAGGQVKRLVATLGNCDFVQIRLGGKAQPTVIDRSDLPALISKLMLARLRQPGHHEPPVAWLVEPR